jgi:mannitol/fructose-specific phosphotransferase system IIA component (Ntr-type)
MDDKNASVKVSLVVFLIITDPTIYNKFLSRLVTIFQDTKIQRFINNGDLEPLKEAIEKIE